VSIAANKVPGVRAALCGDAETARGARAWNQANVLCLSLRGTSEIVAREILDSWFSTEADAGEEGNVAKVNELDRRYRPAVGGEAEASTARG
jgi:ribose 5-phosphate isomerase B